MTTKRLHRGGRQFELKSRKTRSQTVISPRAPVCLVGGQLGDAAQPVVAKTGLRCRRRQSLFVLADDAALGGFEDGEQVVDGKRLADDADGQPADEFRLEPELDEIARLRLRPARLPARPPGGLGGEADGGVAQALLDDFLQAVERAADDEQNVFAC